MANNPEIVVEIGAVTDKLVKGVDGSILSLEKLEKEIGQLNQRLKTEVDPTQIIALNQRLNELTVGVKNLKNSGIEPLTKATSKYNSVGTDFARIIQDAPFGIIGVGNNITQLATSFGTLQAQSKSTGAALKTAFASIFSSGNLLVLGISVLTTVLTVLQQKGFFKTKESAEDAQKALDNYRNSLNGIKKASLEGEISAQKEIQNFNLLKAQAENANIPLNKRIEAVNKLKKEYPDYLKNLTNEQILTGNVAGAYDKLNKNLLETAKARAASSIIIKNFEEVLLLQEQQIDNTQAIINAREKVARLEASAANSAVNALKVNGQITAQNTDLVRAKKELNDLLQPQIERGNRINELTNQNLSLNNQINTSLENGATFTRATLEKTEKLKRVFEDLSKLPITNSLERFDEQSRQFESPISATSGRADTLGINTQNIAEQTKGLTALQQALNGTGISVEQFYAAIANGAAEGFDSLQEFINALSSTQQLIDNTFKTLELGLETTIGDLAFAIGDALASGANVLEASGAVLLGGLANVLNQLGQLAIGTGIAIGGIKKALLTLNPAVAIGAGVALIALAGFVSNKARSLGNFGGGGSSVASGAGTSGISQGTSFTGQSTSVGFDRSLDLRGAFTISGTDLVYVIDRARESQI
jgi:hypothetical protein